MAWATQGQKKNMTRKYARTVGGKELTTDENKRENFEPTYAQLITAVNIYNDYWDFIPEKERVELDKRLKAVGC